MAGADENNDRRLEFIMELLRSAPAGQFNALLENVQKLAGAPLEGELLSDIQRQYETQTCSGASSGDASSSSASTHPLAPLLRDELAAYQSGLYDKANNVTARREIANNGADENGLLIRTYAERIDEEKCRTGSWTCEWSIRTTADSSAEVSGQVSMCVFSYEDGNVQIRSTKVFPVTSVEAETASELAKQIIHQHITTWENEVLGSLTEAYGNVGPNLKAIRGILPITKTRLNWNAVAQRTVRTLQEAVNK